MHVFVWLLVLALIVLHQDNWFWYDATLVFGFLPIGLFYHVGISVAAGIIWYLATKFCWPSHLDDVSPDEPQAEGPA